MTALLPRRARRPAIARQPSAEGIFVHIQKTGGNSVKAALGWPKNPQGRHRTALELRASLGEDVWQSSFSFAFVRNPWDRLVSWWTMIDASRPRYEQDPRRSPPFWAYVLSNARTFEEFVLECTETLATPGGVKSIMRPQLEYVADEEGTIIVDFVGRFESIDDDFRTVAARFGRHGVALPHVNRSRNRRPYRDYYDPALADLVAERLRPDLEAFGYEF